MTQGTRHKDKAQGTRHKAQGTRHKDKAQGTRYKVQGTRHRTQYTNHKPTNKIKDYPKRHKNAGA